MHLAFFGIPIWQHIAYIGAIVFIGGPGWLLHYLGTRKKK
jgi:hypothetical protein